jgi:hypothetical protein
MFEAFWVCSFRGYFLKIIYNFCMGEIFEFFHTLLLLLLFFFFCLQILLNVKNVSVVVRESLTLHLKKNTNDGEML